MIIHHASIYFINLKHSFLWKHITSYTFMKELNTSHVWIIPPPPAQTPPQKCKCLCCKVTICPRWVVSISTTFFVCQNTRQKSMASCPKPTCDFLQLFIQVIGQSLKLLPHCAAIFFLMFFLSVHLSITVVNDQLSTQLLYFIIRLL
jgi:hypothetical protein